jgi:hypothetical protein
MATDIKFTRTLVEEVAARVKEFTNGAFALEATGSDLGNGTRYIDAHEMRVWYGPEGARQACAYYIGGALGTARATGREIPANDAEYLRRVQAAYTQAGTRASRANCRSWEERGEERARLKVEADRA